MKKIIVCFILLGMFLTALTGCGGIRTSQRQTNDFSSSTSETSGNVSESSGKTSSKEDVVTGNCTLIVKGKDISNCVYVWIDAEKQAVELPITAIMKELGADVEWRDDTTVAITYEGRERIIDTKEEDYGYLIPPGTMYGVRKVVNDDVIFEYESAMYFLSFPDVSLYVDYEHSIITVCTGEDVVNGNCKTLVVKGKNIADRVYAWVDSEKRTAELPITAILEELGANVMWKDVTTVEITYKGEKLVFDAVELDYGFTPPEGTAHAVRKIFNDDVILEYESALQILTAWGVFVNVDYDHAMIEIS